MRTPALKGAALAAVTAVALTTTGLAGGGREAAAAPAAARKATTIFVRSLPPIAQPGFRPAAPPEGRLISARFTPLSVGASATLLRQTDSGWKTVSRKPVDRFGYANFHVKADAVYRVEGAGGRSTAVTATATPPDLADGFSGSRLNGRLWKTQQIGYNPGGMRTCAKPGAAYSVSGGTVKLGIRRDPSRLGKVCRYRTAKGPGTAPWLLNTQLVTENTYEFTHGVAAMRVKFQRARGSHVGMWLQSFRYRKPNKPSRGVEVDVAEYFGQHHKGNHLASFVYMSGKNWTTLKLGDKRPITSALLPAGHTFWNSYHVVSVEWTPTSYTMRLDGRGYWKVNRWISQVPQYLVLSNLSSDYELKNLSPLSFSAPAQVDWVRVWER